MGLISPEIPKRPQKVSNSKEDHAQVLNFKGDNEKSQIQMGLISLEIPKRPQEVSNSKETHARS